MPTEILPLATPKSLGMLLTSACVSAQSLSHDRFFVTPWTVAPARLLCSWDFPGKHVGLGCHFLLPGIFLTQRSNPCLLHLLHWQVDSLPLCHLGNPQEGQRMKKTCKDRLRNLWGITRQTNVFIIGASEEEGTEENVFEEIMAKDFLS